MDCARKRAAIVPASGVPSDIALSCTASSMLEWAFGAGCGLCEQDSSDLTRTEYRPTLTLHAGDPFLIPPHTPHNALDVGPDIGHMLSTYILEVGQPLASFTT